MANEFKLEITFNPDTKDCKVTGPLNELELCLMGLEMARRILIQMKSKKLVLGPILPAQQKNKMIVPTPDLRKILKNGG